MFSIMSTQGEHHMEDEVRIQAVQRHFAGESPKAIYTSLNRSKKWFFKWLNRFQSGADNWYKDHSRAPLTRPAELGTAEKDLIVTTRNRLDSEPFAQIGVSAIKWELQKLGLSFRSDSTINRTLKREGLVKKNSIFAQRCRISAFYRSLVLQQHPPDGSCWPPLHQG